MRSKRMLINFAVSFSLGALSLQAGAECSQSDIAGTWRLFAGTTAMNFEGFGHGKVTFTADGSLITSSSGVRLSDGTVINFLSGEAIVRSGCRVTGSLESNLGITFSLIDGQMDINKSTIVGVYTRSDGDEGILNLVRK